MLKVLLIFLSAYIFAGEVFITTNYKNFETNYTVSDPNRSLKSKLIFPHTIQTLGLGYQYNYKDYSLQISSQFLLHQKKNIGEDFDWKDDELTVYSNSKDILDKYKHYEISIKKNFFPDFSMTGNFVYRDIQEHWSDTKQDNFVTDTTTQLTGRTLQYQQTFYQYSLGITYSKEVLKEITMNFNPSFVYSYIDTKDTHILRDFYVLQNCHAFGYDLKLSLEKELTIHSALRINFQYTSFEDTKTDMRYYFVSSKDLFATYPSSYKYKNINIGIKYLYKF